MNLDEIASGESPFGEVNATDPKSYVRVMMVAFVLFAGLGLGRFLFDQTKSATGVEDSIEVEI